MLRPDVLAVHVDDQDALRGADVEHDPPPSPVGRQLELALVDTGRVVVGHVRWEAGERHLDVRVLRPVVEALHRPAAGTAISLQASAGLRVRLAEQLEPPRPVELDPVGVRHRMHRQAVEGRQFRGEPRPDDPREPGDAGDRGHRAAPAAVSSSCQACAGR